MSHLSLWSGVILRAVDITLQNENKTALKVFTLVSRMTVVAQTIW